MTGPKFCCSLFLLWSWSRLQGEEWTSGVSSSGSEQCLKRKSGGGTLGLRLHLCNHGGPLFLRLLHLLHWYYSSDHEWLLWLWDSVSCWSTATSSVQCFLGDAFNQDEKELTSGEANDKEKSKSIKKILDLLLKIQPLGRHITLVSHKDIRNISRWGTIHTNKQTNKTKKQKVIATDKAIS